MVFKVLTVIGIAVVLSLIVMIVCGFNMPDEIQPGEGFSLASKTVNVKADNPKWTDSGIKISLDKKFEFSVIGSVFFCSGEDSETKQKTSIIRSAPIPVRASNENYTPSGIKVATGDIIRFGLVQNARKIASCTVVNSPGETKFISLDADNTFYDSSGKPLLQKDACRGGDMYDSSKKLITTLTSYENFEVSKYTSNDLTENGNKWIRGAQGGRPLNFDLNTFYKQNWIQGAFADLRTNVANNNKIDRLTCNVNTTSDGVALNFKQYESYELNNKCKKFAHNGANGNAFSYFIKTETKNIAGIPSILPFLDENNQTFEIAEGLVGGYGQKTSEKEVITMVPTQQVNNVTTCLPYKNICSIYFSRFIDRTLNTYDRFEISNLHQDSVVNFCQNMFGDIANNPESIEFRKNESVDIWFISKGSEFYPYDMYSIFSVTKDNIIFGSPIKFQVTPILEPNRILNKGEVEGISLSELQSYEGNLKCYKSTSQELQMIDMQVTDLVPVVTFEDCYPKGAGGSSNNCKTAVNYSNEEGIAKSSLRLNYDYKVEKEDILDSELFLAIANDDNRYENSYGGYNVQISKSCPRYDGKDLYLYIGDTPPPKSVKEIANYQASTLKKEDNFVIENSNASGKLHFLIADPKKPVPAAGYDNSTHDENMGEYKVSFVVSSTPTWVSDSVRILVDPLQTLIMGVSTNSSGQTGPTSGIAYDMYHSIIDSGIRTFARLLMVMFIIIVSMGFVLGIIEIKTNELLIIIFKIGAVSALLTDTSWEFFNKYLLNIFWYGADDIIMKFMDFYNGKSSYKYNASFAFLDKTVGTLLQWENIVRIFSLLGLGFINPLSWFLFIAIIGGVLNILQSCFKGIILYCICLVINGFLIALTPIFICFMLFKQTFRFFDTWIKQLMSNMFLIVFYFLAIGMINEMIFFLLYKVLNYGVYSKCILGINIGDLKLCLMQFPMPFPVNALTELTSSGSQIEDGLPISFMDIVTFYIVCKMSNILVSVCSSLSQIFSGASMAFSASTVMQHVVNAGKYTIGRDDASIKRRKDAIKKVDKKQTTLRPRGQPTRDVSTGNKNINSASKSSSLPGAEVINSIKDKK